MVKLSQELESQAALKAEASELKKALLGARAYSMHRTLAQTVRENKAQVARLSGQIQAMEEEKAKAQAALHAATAERDALHRQLSEAVHSKQHASAAVQEVRRAEAASVGPSLSSRAHSCVGGIGTAGGDVQEPRAGGVAD